MWFLAAFLCCGLGSAQAQTVTNKDVPDNLNLGTSWVGGTPAGSGNVAVWNNIVQVNTNKALGAATSWAGIQILDPGALIIIGQGNTTDNNTLTLGASGVDMSQAAKGLTLFCPVVWARIKLGM